MRGTAPATLNVETRALSRALNEIMRRIQPSPICFATVMAVRAGHLIHRAVPAHHRPAMVASLQSALGNAATYGPETDTKERTP